MIFCIYGHYQWSSFRVRGIRWLLIQPGAIVGDNRKLSDDSSRSTSTKKSDYLRLWLRAKFSILIFDFFWSSWWLSLIRSYDFSNFRFKFHHFGKKKFYQRLTKSTSEDDWESTPRDSLLVFLGDFIFLSNN